MAVGKLNRRHGRVKLPKLGWVKFRMSRPLAGVVIRSATLIKDGAQWYLSLLVNDGIEGPQSRTAPDTAVGVDRGVVVAVATSAGELLDRPFSTAGEQRRVLRLQRRLSRSTKGSANRGKTRAALAAVRARERHRRADFCHTTAHQLAHANTVVVLEKLSTKNMTRRAPPVADPSHPGGFLPNGAAAKSGLNKAILSKGWYRFEQALQSVSRYTGTNVVKVSAAFTSQRCLGVWVCGPEIA
jgi:putative transposase